MRKKFIGEIERGTSNPSLGSMALVALGLGCSVADLLAPPTGEPYLMLRADEMRRAQDAVAALHAVLKTRKRTP